MLMMIIWFMWCDIKVSPSKSNGPGSEGVTIFKMVMIIKNLLGIKHQTPGKTHFLFQCLVVFFVSLTKGWQGWVIPTIPLDLRFAVHKNGDELQRLLLTQNSTKTIPFYLKIPMNGTTFWLLMYGEAELQNEKL